MRRKLPPLSLLAAAETVSRCESFTAAAAELNVTPSAISHQVKSLETWLGFKLFRRNSRSLRLTPQGGAYLSEVSGLLDRLEAITLSAMEDAGRTTMLRVQTTDSFAGRWLVRRLPRFQATHPSVSVRIVTREFSEGFKPDDADMAILYGRGDWDNFFCSLLLKEEITAVCSPQRLERAGSGILREGQFIHDDNLGVTWADWLAFAGLAGAGMSYRAPGLHFGHSHLALQAAERGDGIALASWPLVMDAVADGRLVMPFAARMATGSGYYIVQPASAERRKRCRILCDWLVSEAEAGPS